MTRATVTPARTLLTPTDHTLLLIDHQPQMAFGVANIDVTLLRNNAAMAAHSARVFKVATILTTVSATSFSGPIFADLPAALPEVELIDRTTMNCWEDEKVVARINALGKARVVMGGLWTSVCIVGPVLSALEQGFQVSVLTDACGDTSVEAHERAVQRMVQAGAAPMTSLQYLLELQRDWGRAATYDKVLDVVKAYGGTYGQGVVYAKSMYSASEGTKAH